MRVYLAARYSRHPEMQEYAAKLRDVGFEITSRWINGSHLLDDPASVPDRAVLAQHDWADMMRADVVVSFTEGPDSSYARGGRHVEFGAALAAGKICIVVGWRENVFHCLPQVKFCPNWSAALSALLYLDPTLAVAPS